MTEDPALEEVIPKPELASRVPGTTSQTAKVILHLKLNFQVI